MNGWEIISSILQNEIQKKKKKQACEENNLKFEYAGGELVQ